MHDVPMCLFAKNLGLDLFLCEFLTELPQCLLKVNVSSVVNYEKMKAKRKGMLGLELTLLSRMLFSRTMGAIGD